MELISTFSQTNWVPGAVKKTTPNEEDGKDMEAKYGQWATLWEQMLGQDWGMDERGPPTKLDGDCQERLNSCESSVCAGPNKEVLALWMGARPGQRFQPLAVKEVEALALEKEKWKIQYVCFIHF